MDDDDEDHASDVDISLVDPDNFVTMVGPKSSEDTKVKTHVPPCFFEREAYRHLSEEGLTDIPPGFQLSYHSSTSQWHGRATDGLHNFAPTWGSLRSESMSLLMVLERLWTKHLEKYPEDEHGVTYLDLIREKMKEVNF